MNLVALQFQTDDTNYQVNLDKLVSLINKAQEEDFIVAPELCLTG
jgi:predicted amidohydrolase